MVVVKLNEYAFTYSFLSCFVSIFELLIYPGCCILVA